ITVPKYKNKHLEKALFNPGDYMDYKELPKNKIKKYIITYQTSALNYIKRKYKPKKTELYKLLTIYQYNDIGFVKMTGIGSPNAAGVFEELIALGGKVFLNIGTAGGLHNEGVFLCNKALRDEGTSYHYLPNGDFSYPDRNLTKKLGRSMERRGLEFFEGTTWTIDAPYRETIKEIEEYSKKGISTVEMEASALFAVAKYRNVRIASAFVVSDLLGKKWLPNFHRFDVKSAQNKLIDAAVDCLTNLKRDKNK